MAVHGLLFDVLTRRGVKIAAIGLGLVAGLGGLGAAAYYLRRERVPTPPPAATATDEEALSFVASEGFGKLPVDERIAWLEQRRETMAEKGGDGIRKLVEGADEQTRRRLFENMHAVMQERMNREVDAFHKLPPAERTAFLDKKIDEMEKRRGMAGGPGGPGGPEGPPPSGRRSEPGSPGPGGGPSGSVGSGSGSPGLPGQGGRGGPPPGGPGQMMARMARMPADRRAKNEAYMRAMGKRMAERGIRPPGPPPGPPR